MTDERPSSLRLWLARYKPDRVRCTLANKELRELLKPATTRGQWSQLEHAILVLEPVYIEAFKGESMVASRPLDVDEEDAAPAPVVAPTDPAAAVVAAMPVLAQLFVDTGDRAAERHQEAYKMAFEAMLEQNKQYLQLVQVVSTRLGALERMWHQSLLDRAAQAGGDNDEAAMGLLGRIVSERAGIGPNGASASDKPKGHTDD